MADERSYQLDRIEKLIDEMSSLFDVVRIVDPIGMTVYHVEDGKLVGQAGGCYNVWNKTDRCENCVSSRCFMDQERYSKFEFIDSEIYHVIAQPIEICGRRYVLEVVTASNDNVLITAFGNNDFVNRITTFNHKVYTDDLTGLSNRRFLNERFELMIDRTRNGDCPLAAVMVDVDDFKDVNDLQGHLAGDRVLARVGDVLRDGFEPGNEDILARYGGDEFFAAFWNITREELDTKLRRVKELADTTSLDVTFSMGAYYLEHVAERSAEEIIRSADRVMYRIKAAGKNNYAIDGDEHR